MGMLEPDQGKPDINNPVNADPWILTLQAEHFALEAGIKVDLNSDVVSLVAQYRNKVTSAIKDANEAFLHGLLSEGVNFTAFLRNDSLEDLSITELTDGSPEKALRMLIGMIGENGSSDPALERWLSRQLLPCLKASEIALAKMLIETGFVCPEDLCETVKLLTASGEDRQLLALYFENYRQKWERLWKQSTDKFCELRKLENKESGLTELAGLLAIYDRCIRDYDFDFEFGPLTENYLLLVQKRFAEEQKYVEWASRLLESNNFADVKKHTRPFLWIIELEKCVREIAALGNIEAFQMAIDKSGLPMFGNPGVEGASLSERHLLERDVFSQGVKTGKIDFIEHFSKAFSYPFQYGYRIVKDALEANQLQDVQRLLSLLPADGRPITSINNPDPFISSVESLANYALQIGKIEFFKELVKRFLRIENELPIYVEVALNQGQLEAAGNLITRLPFNRPGPDLNFENRLTNSAGKRFTSTMRALYQQDSPGSITRLFPQVPRDQYSGLTKSGLASSFEEILVETAALASTIDPDSETIPHHLFVELMQGNLRSWSESGMSMKEARNMLATLSMGFMLIKDIKREFSDLVLLPKLSAALADEFGVFAVKKLDFTTLFEVREKLSGHAGRILFHSRRSSDVYRFNALWHRPDKTMPIDCTPLRAAGEWIRCIGDVELSNGWSIHALGTQAELIEEGNTLKHCLGRGGYGPNCLNGELQVLSLRHLGRPNSTILIERQSDERRPFLMTIKLSNDIGLAVPQFVSAGNSNPGPDAENAFREFIDLIRSGIVPLELNNWGETQSSKKRRHKRAVSEVELITGCRIEDGGKQAEDYYRTQLRLYDKKLPKALQEGDPLLRSEIDVDTLKSMFPKLTEFCQQFRRQA